MLIPQELQLSQKNGAAEAFTGALPVVAVISNMIHNQHTDYQHNDI